MTVDNSELNKLLALLILAYQKNLLSGVTKATLEAALSATQSLNIKRLEAGLEDITINDKELAEKALKQVEAYYTQLVEKGGSEVVEDHKFVFKPWLNDLKNTLKEQLLLIEALDLELREDALNELGVLGDQRANLTAEYEILRNEYEITNDIWYAGGVGRVVWRSRDDPTTCPECMGGDGEVFRWDDLPDMPAHPKCRCELEIYEVKDII
jgi:SPP1 gp7 family putative phage head morphogenesis protein